MEPGHIVSMSLYPPWYFSQSAHQAPVVVPLSKAACYVAEKTIVEQIPDISAISHPGIFLSAEPSLRMWTHSLNMSPPAIIPQIHLARNVMPCLMGQLSATQGGG